MTALTLPRSRTSLQARGRLTVAGICVLPLLLNVLLLTEPFDRDEGAYAAVALGLFDGQVPYRDLFDHKPPMIYAWYALSFAVFGENEWAPRLLGCLILCATVYLVYDIARILYSARAARFAALTFSLATGIAVLEPAANVEPFLLLPMVAMLRVALYPDDVRSSRLIFCAGLLGAACLLTKEVAFWNVAVVAGMMLARPQGRRLRLAAFAAGVFLPLFATAVGAYALGAGSEAAYANIRYNLLYGSAVSFEEKLRLAATSIPVVLLFAAPIAVIAGAGSVSAMRRARASDRIVLAWAVASLLGIASTGRFLPHYFVQALPACGLLAACLVANGSDWRLWSAGRRRTTVALSAAAVLVAVALNLPAYASTSSFDRQEAKGMSQGGRNAFSNGEVGAYLRQHTQPSDRVWQAGRESGMYFHSGRQSPVAMFYDRAFWLDEATLTTTLEELRADPPLYVVDALSSVEEYEPEHLVVLEIRVFIAEHYVFETEIAYATIYRLRN